MRISSRTREIIRDAVYEIFGSQAKPLLFGSRTDEAARGGDIDLLIRVDRPVQQPERKALQLIARLQLRLGDQPIDVLVLDPHTKHLPVHEEAIRTGVTL